jgi:DNA repair exonuclease SbcCD ATPase subunit
LLGITLLSEKAEKLKVAIKESKDSITAEQFKIESIKIANENVQKSINSLVIKSSAWENKKDQDIENLSKAIVKLEGVDITQEIKLHVELKEWNDNNTNLRNFSRQKSTLESAVIQAEKTVSKYTIEINKLDSKSCPSCEQTLHDHKHKEMSNHAVNHLSESVDYLNKVMSDLSAADAAIAAIGVQPRQPATFYDSEAEALGHKNNFDSLEMSLINRNDDSNPYQEQIDELNKTAIQAITWNSINELTKFKDHQEFLYKLLTNKDSFIRKKIIDQNLNYLNKRLSYYIEKLGLPHKVIFLNDLTVEITQLGQDLDFDNLSRGERNRLILSMSFAFRDVWEGLYQGINLLFIDELVDSGLDTAGVENALSVLKSMGRSTKKNIFLISHKEELIGRVDNILSVVKLNGFTSYENAVTNSFKPIVV